MEHGLDERRDSALSLAFMRGHPASAARVLEALPAAQAAAIFERAPARVGAAVMEAMLPRQASACIAALDDARAMELIAAMGVQATVSMLRYQPELRRRALVAGLPTASALASTILLGYNEDTLGAWADPDVVMLSPTTRAADALERVRQTRVTTATVFVTDAGRRLAGQVELSLLMRAPEAASLASLMRSPVALLTAHAPLAGAAAHPGWSQASALPVVEPGERLIGVMTHDALVRAVRRSLPLPLESAAIGTLPGLLARGYWQTLSGMAGAGLALLPRVAPVLPQEGDRP